MNCERCPYRLAVKLGFPLVAGAYMVTVGVLDPPEPRRGEDEEELVEYEPEEEEAYFVQH